MEVRTRIYLAGAGLALAAAAAWAFAPRPVDVELATAAPGRFELAVDEDGKTRLTQRYLISAPLAGRLARIDLREGDTVQAGDAVARLSPAPPSLLDERSRRELQARLEAAEAAGEGARARQGKALVAFEQARNDARRSEQLAQQGFIAATRQEADRLAVRAAAQEVQAAEAARDAADHEVEQARAALSFVRRGSAGEVLRGFPVRTPVGGQVLRVLQPSEAVLAPGSPLLEVGDVRELEVVAELLTADALAAGPGSPVLIERWGGPQPLQGRVTRVEPSGFTKVSALGVEEQRVRVLIGISSPREQWQALGDGFRVGVRIVTLVREDALMVPVSAVFPLPAGEGGPGHAVFAVEGGRARLQRVEVAARNGESAWLRQGLAAGARVIVYPPAAVRDGARVRERRV